jgi:hypothetical protein
MSQLQVDHARTVRVLFNKIQKYLEKNNIPHDSGVNKDSRQVVYWLDNIELDEDILIDYVQENIIDPFSIQPTGEHHDVRNNEPGHTAHWMYGVNVINIVDTPDDDLMVSASISIKPPTTVRPKQ